MTPSLFSWRRSGVQCVVERHFWSLTRYRIGRRFFGLDYADNIIFFPAYRKKGWGGWAAVTLGTTHSRYFTNDTSSANVLEDGYPLHWRAGSKLQHVIAEEKRVWQAKRDEELVRRAAQKVMADSGNGNNNNNNNINSGSSGTKGTSEANANVAERGSLEADFELHSEQRFRDALTIKCTSPGFAQRHLRLSRVSTLLYKAIYFYLWSIAVFVVVQAYLMFRAWLHPPARAALRNLEEHALHLPKIIFGFCVGGVTWLIMRLQPLVEPVLGRLEAHFPAVNWRAASPESIASRAQHLVGKEAPAAQDAAGGKEKGKGKGQAEMRNAGTGSAQVSLESVWAFWLRRASFALLLILTFLCLV